MFKNIIIAFFIIFSFIFLPTQAFAEFDGNMICPIDLGEATISSGYYDPRDNHWEGIHGGIDLAAPEGTPIYAAASGIVSYAGAADGFGNAIYINHGSMEGYGEIYTVYGHMSADSIQVYTGEAVSQGDIIAFVGNEGHSTGSHLHFGVQLSMMQGAPKLDPGMFIPEFANGAGGGGRPMDDEGLTMTYDSSFDFAAPIREVIDKFGDACTKALHVLKDSMNKLMVVLITIDFALGAMIMSISPDKGDKFFNWLVYKIVFYGIIIWLILNWGDVVANLSRDFFAGVGAISMGVDTQQVADAISDPSAIVQKGASIVAPIFAEIAKFHGMRDLISKFALIAPCFIFVVILLCSFTIIGLQIALAYIEFYITVLFGFTTFIFAGEKHVRRFANNGLNGIFAASIKLLFFCMFSLLLQNTMQNLSTDAFFSQHVPNSSTNANISYEAGNITSIDELMAKIRVVESQGSGGYAADNGSHYGAYQMDYDYWNNWCQQYIDAGGELDTTTQPEPPQPSNAVYAWTPENQDKVARFLLTGYYETYGSYEAAARAWNQGTGGMWNDAAAEYWAKICGVSATVGVEGAAPVTTVNFTVLFKLVLVCAMFIIMGDRLSKNIMKYFGGTGFRLTN